MAAARDVLLKARPPNVSAALAAVTPLPNVRLALEIFEPSDVAAWGLVTVAFAPVISHVANCAVTTFANDMAEKVNRNFPEGIIIPDAMSLFLKKYRDHAGFLGWG